MKLAFPGRSSGGALIGRITRLWFAVPGGLWLPDFPLTPPDLPMALDAYSLCPCGTGKKIKFCCNDLLPELEKIDRMLEGEQFRAVIQHIEQLEPTYPDRASLLAIKSMVYRVLGQIDEAQATATRFLEKHPTNPVALAESAILTAATEGGRPAINLVQRALSASSQQLEARVYEAIRVVGSVLAAEGEFIPARAMAMLQTALNREDREAMELMVRLNTHPNIPLLFKSERRLDEAPDGAPWKAAFDDALKQLRSARWADGAAQFATLAQQHPEVPGVWRNLAIVRSWLGDTEGTSKRSSVTPRSTCRGRMRSRRSALPDCSRMIPWAIRSTCWI